jgi:N6-adenosine-specific RNA methylase IME4
VSDSRAIDSIIVGERHRRDLGDVASLAHSIAEFDLLHPIVVTPGNVLIAGERRLRAVQQLGWTEVPVTVVDLAEIVRGELAENAERKDFLPSEIEAIRRAMAPEIAAQAKERQSRKVSGTGEETRDRIGTFAGVSGRTVEKIAKVVAAAESEPEKYGKLLADMDRTGKVNGVYRRLSNMQQAEKIRAEPRPLPAGPFRVAVADVPWPYEADSEDPSGRGVHPYATMNLADICALPIQKLLTDDATLWLFITNHHLLKGSHDLVLKAWGFEAVTMLTWAKDRFGYGHWLREQTEHCIMAVRGKPTTTLTNQSTWLGAPMGAHSEKPESFYAMVESLCPAPAYLDLFARKARRGWTAWGAEAPHDPEPETQIARADSPAPPKGQKRVWSETASPDIPTFLLRGAATIAAD